MLKVENIGTAKLDKENWNYREEWRKARLAKFTSSMIYTLMGTKLLTEGALTYIYERVGESLTGIPAKQEVDTNATRWGLLHEADATQKAGLFLGAEFLVTQCLVTAPGSMFGSTPDFLLVKAKYENGYNVATGEVKCYPSYGHYIECALCKTAVELKKIDKKLYWQVIDQMDNCGALEGYAVLYHPDFKAGGFRVIHFRKIELLEDFKLLTQRKIEVVKEFNRVRDELITLQN
jgi:hypothetical protein